MRNPAYSLIFIKQRLQRICSVGETIVRWGITGAQQGRAARRRTSATRVRCPAQRGWDAALACWLFHISCESMPRLCLELPKSGSGAWWHA